MSGQLGAPNPGYTAGSASLDISCGIGTELTELLMADDIQPGSEPSYQLCKTIYLYHPLGGKMVDNPIRAAQSQEREVSIPSAPDRVVREFLKERIKMRADEQIASALRIARIYGISALAIKAEDENPATPLDLAKIAKGRISFSVFDPLNTGGSIAPNQDPNSPEFQQVVGDITVAGKLYHRSRVCVTMNETPIYINYSTSGFGYVGRSVYQRALFPLKSFVWSMVTDEMISRKAGLLIYKAKTPGSVVDRVMQAISAVKRNILKTATVGNVLSVGHEEAIESLNLMNIDGAGGFSRKNILENIAAAADMPAKIINQETFAEGFGEGTEDAKNVARYVERVRRDMDHLYLFMDDVAMHRAWTPEFYETIQAEFPEQYSGTDYQTAFVRWKNDYTVAWPSLLIEPESERAKAEKVKLDALTQIYQAVAPALDPENGAALILWVADNVNDMKLTFTAPLSIDADNLLQFAEEREERAAQQQQQAEAEANAAPAA